MNNNQIYGRNDMVMLEKHNKIYGSLGIKQKMEGMIKQIEGYPPLIGEKSIAGQRVKIFPHGWTTQDSTTGANKLPLDGFYTGNGEKIIPVNDALAFQTVYFIYTELNLSVGSYYFTRKFGDSSLNTLKGINIRTAEANIVSTDIAKVTHVDDYTFKIELFDVSEPLYLYVNTESNIETTLYEVGIFQNYPFIYEPYTGGQPSPSSEYPQPILNAGTYNEETGKYEYGLELHVDNFLNANQIIQEIVSNNIPESYIFKDGIAKGVKQSGTFNQMQFYYDISNIPSGEYWVIVDSASCISSNNTNYSDPNVRIIYQVDEANKNVTNSKKLKFVKEKSQKQCRILISVSNTDIQQDEQSLKEATITNPRICTQENKKYQPYQPPQSVTLTSDRPLTKWDRLVYMDGQWQWEYGGGKKVLDGSIDETYSPYATRNGFSLNGSGLKYGLNQDGFCDKFITRKTNDNNTGVVFGLNTTDIYFVYVYEYAQTESEWREWLSSNNLTIQYPLSIPTYTPLPESEQKALNALRTYYPTTVFSNDQNGFMQIEYHVFENNV